MDATGIRDEIARLEEAGRACTTERDAHRIDIGIERLEAELAALAPAAHHAARRRPTMGPKCMQATRARTDASFLVDKADIVANAYDLSINKYKKTEYVAESYPPPSEILAEVAELEKQIIAGIAELRRKVKDDRC